VGCTNTIPLQIAPPFEQVPSLCTGDLLRDAFAKLARTEAGHYRPLIIYLDKKTFTYGLLRIDDAQYDDPKKLYPLVANELRAAFNGRLFTRTELSTFHLQTAVHRPRARSKDVSSKLGEYAVSTDPAWQVKAYAVSERSCTIGARLGLHSRSPTPLRDRLLQAGYLADALVRLRVNERE
jgi:hypothetical protein